MAKARPKKRTPAAPRKRAPKAGPVQIAASLEAAATAIAAARWADALRALLAAWGALRHPRIADVIDRVAARIERPPIRGKTAAAREAAWREIVRAKDPADLGRLLARDLWPALGARVVIRNLAGFPPDPRAAIAFTREILAGRYRDPRHAFYPALHAKVASLGDVRALAVFEAARVVDGPTVERLRAIAVPALDPAEEAAVARVEAPFAQEVAAQVAHGKGAAEFLADIYAHPDDDDLRRVFADWLLERGDERGELIALQLSGVRTEASSRREAALIARHGDAWAGPLHPFLVKTSRTWRRGFLATGELRLGVSAHEVPAGLSDPAWSTMRAIELSWMLAGHYEELSLQIVELPWVRAVHALYGLHEATAAAVLLGEPRPQLRELGLNLLGHARGLRDALHLGDAVPNLERLTVNARAELLWLLATPLGHRITSLAGLTRSAELGPWLAAVTAQLGPAHRLDEIALHQIPDREGHTVWHFAVARDDRGRFRRLRASPFGANTLPDRAELVRALASLPDDGLVELTIPATRTNTYGADDIVAVEQALARFGEDLRVDVPWPRLAASRAPTVALRLDVGGVDLAVLWDLVHRLPRRPAFDACEVDTRGHRPLPGDALAHVAAQVDRPRTRRVRVYESGGGAELELTTVRRAIFRAVIRCTVPDEPAAIEAYLAWMVAVVEDLRPSHASAGFAVAVPYRGDATVHDVFLNAEGIRQLGWIERLDPRVWRLPIAALTALVEEPGLRWCRAVTVRTGLLFVAAPSPHRPPSLAQQDALADGYARALFESCRELLGFHPRELFAELVVPALAARDYTPAGPPSRYVQVFANGSRRVRFHIELDLSKVGLTLRLIAEHHLDPDERYPHPAKGIAVAKPADAEAARAAFSGWPAALDALDPWFEATYEAWLTA